MGGSGFPDALLPLKSDFRLNPNDLTHEASEAPRAGRGSAGFSGLSSCSLRGAARVQGKVTERPATQSTEGGINRKQ